MEYFIGSVLTLASVYFMNRLVSKSKKVSGRIGVPKFSQSHTDDMLKDYYPIMNTEVSFSRGIKTQAISHFDSRSTRILYMDGYAWFIKVIDGLSALHVAEISEEGIIEESAKRVDIMGMDDVELKKTMFIVEKLTEGLQ